MTFVREALHRYQHASPDIFELRLETHQSQAASHKEQNRFAPATTTMTILFNGNTIEGNITLETRCKVQVRQRRPKSRPKVLRISITHEKVTKSLEAFLDLKFPIFGLPLDRDVMYNWWRANGKTFNWDGLPTELKERIIECCMYHDLPQGMYVSKLRGYERRTKRLHITRKPGPFEIIEQLTDWYQLLYVSHQVRVLTLRLCLNGSRILPGLCVVAESHVDFAESRTGWDPFTR